MGLKLALKKCIEIRWNEPWPDPPNPESKRAEEFELLRPPLFTGAKKSRKGRNIEFISGGIFQKQVQCSQIGTNV